jgi:hypothetical protein
MPGASHRGRSGGTDTGGGGDVTAEVDHGWPRHGVASPSRDGPLALDAAGCQSEMRPGRWHPRDGARASWSPGNQPSPMTTYYQSLTHLTQLNASVFDTLHTPGQATPHSGIYRCEGCGAAVASNTGNPLPPQNHHQHSSAQGAIRWRLIVWA